MPEGGRVAAILRSVLVATPRALVMQFHVARYDNDVEF